MVKILFVDNDHTLAEKLKFEHQAEMEYYSINDNFKERICRFKGSRFDYVVLDLVLNEWDDPLRMDGLELVPVIREAIGKNTQIIFISGHEIDVHKKHIIRDRYKPFEILEKPFDNGGVHKPSDLKETMLRGQQLLLSSKKEMKSLIQKGFLLEAIDELIRIAEHGKQKDYRLQLDNILFGVNKLNDHITKDFLGQEQLMIEEKKIVNSLLSILEDLFSDCYS